MEKMRRRCYRVDGMVEPDRPLTEQELEELQQNLARLSEPSVKEVYRQVTTAMSLPTRCSVFPTRSGVRLPDEQVRKIEIAYPEAFCRAAKAGGARVCGVMTANGRGPRGRDEVSAC